MTDHNTTPLEVLLGGTSEFILLPYSEGLLTGMWVMPKQLDHAKLHSIRDENLMDAA